MRSGQLTPSRAAERREGCRRAANYTAGDSGSATLQPGFVGRVYHGGNCHDTGANQAAGTADDEDVLKRLPPRPFFSCRRLA